MYILAGGTALLLVIVALAALLKVMRPEPSGKSSGSDFTQRLPRAEPLSAPQEAASASREPDSHMFLPGDEPEGETPKPPDPTEPVGPLPEAGEPIAAPPKQAARKPPPKSDSGEQRRGVKLAPKGFDSGQSGSGGGFGSFGGGNLGGASLSAPASNAPPAGDLSVAERLGTTPASQGAAAKSFDQPKKRSMNKTGGGSGQQKISGKIDPFKKDPTGERTSDEAGGVKPGWVRLDDGTVIYVLEMSGVVTDSKDKAAGGESAGGGGGTVGAGAGQVDQAALENAVKAGGGQAVVGR